MSALPERINEILESMDGPDRGRQSRLAEIAGASRQVVNHWLSGVIQSMDFRYAVNIHNQLGWSIDWLISGKTPKKAPRPRMINTHSDDQREKYIEEIRRLNEKEFDRLRPQLAVALVACRDHADDSRLETAGFSKKKREKTS